MSSFNTTSSTESSQLKYISYKLSDMNVKINDFKSTSYVSMWVADLKFAVKMPRELTQSVVANLKIAIDTYTANDYVKNFVSNLGLSLNTTTYKDFCKNIVVNLKNKVTTSTSSGFYRTHTANLKFNMVVTKLYEDNFYPKFKLLIDKMGNAGQNISDIRLYSKALNETNYDDTITPYGYGKWKQMIAGDYIYKDAICKYTMTASLNADRPNTRQYLHLVDVPDVTDRGTVTLTTTNQPLQVDFTDNGVRNFHIVPELNVTLKSYSGTDTTPIIIPYNVTTTSFMISATSNGDYVNCTVTYAARGY